jgi:hypothetical protein
MNWTRQHTYLLAGVGLAALAVYMYGGTLANGINNYLQTNAQINQQNQEAQEAEEYSQTLALQNALAGSTGGSGTGTIAQPTVGGSPAPLTATQQVNALSGAGISTTAPSVQGAPALVPAF